MFEHLDKSQNTFSRQNMFLSLMKILYSKKKNKKKTVHDYRYPGSVFLAIKGKSEEKTSGIQLI